MREQMHINLCFQNTSFHEHALYMEVKATHKQITTLLSRHTISPWEQSYKTLLNIINHIIIGGTTF